MAAQCRAGTIVVSVGIISVPTFLKPRAVEVIGRANGAAEKKAEKQAGAASRFRPAAPYSAATLKASVSSAVSG